MKQCLECGTFSPDDTMFCAVCGKRFSDAIDISSAESDNFENVELSRNVQSQNTQNHGQAGVMRRDEPTRLKFLEPQVGDHLH